ncbi:MAG: InlB B-repeat-containing protein, partial [Synergistaceae bacterium]|nr:InlB B-repeat-containing protein [Synergistaceae bacterium]
VFGAIWQHATSTVTYDLNGGSWSSSSNTASVSYGNTVTQPTDPTRNAYAFSGWTVKSRTRAMKGTQEVTLAAGSNFDFSTTKITEDITLQAAWKHVHSYAYIPLSNINSVIPGALPQEYIDKYGQYFHFKLCSLADDRCFEAHEYDKNGKCVCGAEKPSTEVTLEQTYGNRNATLVFRSKPQKNSPVTLSAPSTIGTDKFIKWEYRSLDSTTWHDLASHPAIGFVIPGSMRVNAVYRPLTSPDLTLTAERYGDDGLLFMMQYVLPKGWKATNAAVLYGDNHMVRYMEVVRSHTPVASLELTDPFLGIPIPGTQIDVGTFDEATYYYDREDNLLAVDGNKGVLRVNMLNGTAVNIPGYNEVTGKKADNLGQTSGYACGGLTGVKDANNGNRYIYVLGFVEYTDADGTEHLTAVGPIAVTYNSASNTITGTEIYTYHY